MAANTVGYTEEQHYKCLEDLELTYTLKSIDPLYLTYCGMERCAPDHSFGPHVRDNYVIHVVLDGSGIFIPSGVEIGYHISAGQAFVIYPGEETTYRADSDSPWTYIWAGFNGYWSETVLEEIGFSWENPVITIQDTAPVFSAVNQMIDAREITVSNALRRKAAFYDGLASLIELNVDDKPIKRVSDIKYVNMAVDLMAASYNKKVRIAEIADRIGINRSYLTNIFKREMHMSPQSFLINLRLEKAAGMLKESEESITNIAASVGYNDSLAFSKAFKQKFGVSPSIYRTLKPELKEVNRAEDYQRRYNL